MEIICQKEQLLRGLQIVEKATAGKEALSILEGIYLETGGDKLHLAATNLEVGMECDIPVQQIVRGGKMVIHGQLLTDIIRRLPGPEVLIKRLSPTSAEGTASPSGEESPFETPLFGESSVGTPAEPQENRENMVLLASGRASFEIVLMDEEAFPELPEVAEGEEFRVSQPLFRRMLEETTFAAAVSESRKFLTGCFLEVTPGRLTLVATDIHRLALAEQTLLEETPSVKAIIPARLLAELKGILGDDPQAEVGIRVGASRVMFKVPGVSVVTRLLEGDYPDYRGVIPTQVRTTVRMSREELMAAVERQSVSRFVRDGVSILIFNFQEKEVEIKNDAPVGKAREIMPVELEGEPMLLAFNGRYLHDVLRVLEGEEVELLLTSPETAAIVREPGRKEYTYLLMPIRLNNA